MGESIFVVIIILLLIVFGIVFASNVEKDEVAKKREELLDMDSITISKYASTLVELQCSLLDVTDLSCFDIHKMNAFINVTKKHPELSAEYYFSQFGNANISVQEIYPGNRTWQIYYNDVGVNNTGRSKQTIVPISLYDGITKKKTFGVLSIKTITR